MYYKHLYSVLGFLTMLLSLVAVIGDYAVSQSNLHIYRALFDNTTHAVIGGISWLIVCVVFKSRNIFQDLCEIAICMIVSSGIDLDHFLVAGSFHLKDATSISGRPPLHCSSFAVLLLFYLFCIAYYLEYNYLIRFTLIIFTAFASHHTRDATRRGYWFYPLGNTKPIPYLSYIALTLFIPYFCCYLLFNLTACKYLNDCSSV